MLEKNLFGGGMDIFWNYTIWVRINFLGCICLCFDVYFVGHVNSSSHGSKNSKLHHMHINRHTFHNLGRSKFE